MSYTLDVDVTSTTQYVELRCPQTERCTIQITNGAVFVGFGQEARDPGFYYNADEPFLPVVGTLRRSCDRIRVRARAPISNPVPHVMITAVPS